MTMYEPNPDVKPTGAEADELVDTPHNEPGDHSAPETPERTGERDDGEDETGSRP